MRARGLDGEAAPSRQSLLAQGKSEVVCCFCETNTFHVVVCLLCIHKNNVRTAFRVLTRHPASGLLAGRRQRANAVGHSNNNVFRTQHFLVVLSSRGFVHHIDNDTAGRVYDKIRALKPELPDRQEAEPRMLKAVLAILASSNEFATTVDEEMASAAETQAHNLRLRLPNAAAAAGNTANATNPSSPTGFFFDSAAFAKAIHEKTPEQLLVASLKARTAKRATLLCRDGAFQVQYLNDHELLIDGVAQPIS